jgi:DNA-binding NarL/FixJ family response regulator
MAPRILVCDDHPIVRDAMEVCLRSFLPDCIVVSCGTLADASVHLAAPGCWSLVLLDLALPDARGFDALSRVRAQAPRVPVAVMSALEDRDTVERVLRAGAVAFLPKSADSAVLVSSLQRLLGIVGRTGDPSGHGAASLAAGGGTAVSGPEAAWVHDALASMTPRQTQVLRLLLRGLSNREICENLGVSENTIKIHIGSVLRTLRARNRTEAVALASRVGFGS